MNPILEKVKKLLALANNAGATEGERDNALRMANNLLLKHNLDMIDLQKHEQIEGREDYVNGTFGMTWCKTISGAVARLFMCKYYFGAKINGTKIEHHFVGKASSACTAALMSEYIISSILKECRSKWKHNLAPESRSFATGAASKVYERVAEMIKNAAPPEGSTSTSLVVQELYKTELDANMEFLKSTGVSLTTSKARATKVNLSAYAAGKEFGNGIGLNNQVTGKNTLRIGK